MNLASRHEVTLLGLASAFMVLAAATLGVSNYFRFETYDWEIALGVGVWAVCAWVAFFFARRALPRHDPYLLPVAYLLSGWGLLLIGRLSTGFGLRQMLWLMVATVVLVGVMHLPGNLRWLRRFRYTWLLLGLGLTALTLFFGVNPSGMGQELWLGGFGIYLQPAEVLKLLLVAFLASYLADRREQLFEAHTRSAQNPKPAVFPTFSYLVPMLLMWGFSMLILLIQRDLGMSTLFFSLFIVMLYLASGRLRYVVMGLCLLFIAALSAYLLFDVVRLRVEAWWNPWLDPAGRSYQIVQSLIALAAGGLFGRGFGLGFPGLIPVAHSDFIFAVVVEEWGLAGAIAVVGLLAALIVRGLRVGLIAPGIFNQLLAGGLTALLGLPALLILGGVIKLIPLTGLTLPFMSYGGSSLLVNFVILGLLLHLSNAEYQKV